MIIVTVFRPAVTPQGCAAWLCRDHTAPGRHLCINGLILLQFSGQPLLHKAVLHGYAEITQLLTDTLLHVTKQKIDSIRDQVQVIFSMNFLINFAERIANKLWLFAYGVLQITHSMKKEFLSYAEIKDASEQSDSAFVVCCLNNISHVMTKPVYAICEQQKRWSDCASAQSDLHLCCSLPG